MNGRQNLVPYKELARKLERTELSCRLRAYQYRKRLSRQATRRERRSQGHGTSKRKGRSTTTVKKPRTIVPKGRHDPEDTGDRFEMEIQLQRDADFHAEERTSGLRTGMLLSPT